MYIYVCVRLFASSPNFSSSASSYAFTPAYCPCIYIESIQNATLLTTFECGDEIVAIDGQWLLGKSLTEADALRRDDKARYTHTFPHLSHTDSHTEKVTHTHTYTDTHTHTYTHHTHTHTHTISLSLTHSLSFSLPYHPNLSVNCHSNSFRISMKSPCS